MDRLYFETKVLAEDNGAITGIGWKFSQADRIGDMIDADAFKGAVMPLPLLFGHDPSDPIGIWETAEAKGDSLQLSGKLLIDAVPRAREVFALVKAGAVRGISIGFATKRAVSRIGGGRTIKALELLEASLVTIPMHPGARVTSAKDAVSALRVAAAIQRATAQLAAR